MLDIIYSLQASRPFTEVGSIALKWGPDGRVVWGAGFSSCDLQVAGPITVAARSCDPPHHRSFGERDVGIDWKLYV